MRKMSMMKAADLVLSVGLLVAWVACSSTPSPVSDTSMVRQHADRASENLQRETGQSPSDSAAVEEHVAPPEPVVQNGVQVPLGEVRSSDVGLIRATGYGPLNKGLTLCQHSADLAARVELSKLVRVQVTEKSMDRQRERTGKKFEQDIEVVREGLVNQILTDVRIVDRKVDKENGTCMSTVEVPRQSLFRISPLPSENTAVR